LSKKNYAPLAGAEGLHH